MKQKTCKICKHFLQYYIKCGRSYYEISYGRCIHKKMKKRYYVTPACNHFKQRKKEDVQE